MNVAQFDSKVVVPSRAELREILNMAKKNVSRHGLKGWTYLLKEGCVELHHFGNQSHLHQASIAILILKLVVVRFLYTIDWESGGSKGVEDPSLVATIHFKQLFRKDED